MSPCIMSLRCHLTTSSLALLFCTFFGGGGLRRHANGRGLQKKEAACFRRCPGLAGVLQRRRRRRTAALFALPAPAPAKKRTNNLRCYYRHNNTHRGATTPSRRRRHPAPTVVSRNCAAASRGAAARPLCCSLVPADAGRNRGHGLDQGEVVTAPRVTSRRVACACARMT